MSRRRLAAPLAVALLLVGCATSGRSEDATTTTAGNDAGTTTTTGEAPVPTIEWSDCEGGFECGTLEVPRDHADPDGPTVELAVTRHRADEPDQRIGTLFVNPGGPGGSATELARTLPRAGELGDRFDIVGFDPRGVGESAPIHCATHLQDIYDTDPTVDSPEDEQAILETSEAFVDECAEEYGDLLPHLGTTDVARDMNAVRAALGEEQISYLGYSYGTSLGQEYARLFPTRVRAMILDGVVDHEPNGITTARAQAEGFETAFLNYVAHCAEEGCGLDLPADQAVDRVMAAAEEAPIPAPDANRPAGPGVVSLALAQALYSEQLWGTLSRGLRDALEGDGSGLVELADMYIGDPEDSGFEVYFGVSCLDDTWPRDTDAFFDAAAEAERDTPRFGSAIVIDYIRCALWPAEPAPLAPVPADTEGLPPVLVISTTGDPATPYENGVNVATQIPGAVLLTNQGEGHTIALLGKPCIDDLVLAYLTDLETPPGGTVCPP